MSCGFEIIPDLYKGDVKDRKTCFYMTWPLYNYLGMVVVSRTTEFTLSTVIHTS